jgi:hypothetical protein
MKRSVIKELIKRSMREVAPKTNSGVMTPEEEKDAAAMAAINKYEKEEKEMDLRSGPSVVPGAVPMKEGSNIPTDIKWEVADVLDYYDNYSADLTVHGYSPTTGKTYGGSVVGTEAGGGDWDFQESDIDYIEEMPEDSPINEASSKSAEILNRPAHAISFEQMGMIMMLADELGENRQADEFLSGVVSKKAAQAYIEKLITRVDGEDGVLAEAEKIVAAWAEKQTIKEEMIGGYIDVLGSDFEDGVKMVEKAWNVWKAGSMTEPGMVDGARQDIMTHIGNALI